MLAIIVETQAISVPTLRFPLLCALLWPLNSSYYTSWEQDWNLLCDLLNLHSIATVFLSVVLSVQLVQCVWIPGGIHKHWIPHWRDGRLWNRLLPLHSTSTHRQTQLISFIYHISTHWWSFCIYLHNTVLLNIGSVCNTPCPMLQAQNIAQGYSITVCITGTDVH